MYPEEKKHPQKNINIYQIYLNISVTICSQLRSRSDYYYWPSHAGRQFLDSSPQVLKLQATTKHWYSQEALRLDPSLMENTPA